MTPHLPDDRHVPSRLDLELDPPIAEANELLDALEQPGDLGAGSRGSPRPESAS